MPVEYDSRQPALVTHISADNLFYVQLDTKEAYALSELSTSIECFVTPHPRVLHPEVGERYFALSSVDDVWYRAIAISISDAKVSVYYVDYGNTEVIPFQSLARVSETLFCSPYQAVQCVLSDFMSTEVNSLVVQDELLNTEAYIVIQSKCSGQHNAIPSIPCYNVALYTNTDSTCTISESLVQRGLGQFRICNANVQSGQKYKAFTSFYDSPGKFWVQLSDQYQTLLDLMKKLNDKNTTGALKPLPLSSVIAGSVCCCVFDQDNRYYRAEIIEVILEKKRVKISFVDYGDTSTVKLSDIMLLPPSLCLNPSFAVQCCLEGIKPIKAAKPHPEFGNIAWSSEVCQKFEKLADDVEFEMNIVSEISPEVFSVHLFDIKMGIDMGKLLCDIECAETTASSSRQSSVPLVAAKPATYSYLELEIKKTYKNMLISYAECPSVVWCQPAQPGNEEEMFETLMAELKAVGVSLSPLDVIEVDLTCCVQYSLDESWCRGIVQSINSSLHTAEVLCVDFGNIEVTKWVDIKALPVKYLSLPARAVSFSLANICPAGEDGNWSEKANVYFQNMVMEQEFDCETIGLDVDGYPAVIMYDPRKQNRIVSLDLVEQGYAKKLLTSVDSGSQLNQSPSSSVQSKASNIQQSQRVSQNASQMMSLTHSKTASDVSHRHTSSDSLDMNTNTFSPLDLLPGQILDALVCHVVSPTDFYIQPTTKSSRLEQFTHEAQAHCKSSKAVRVRSPKADLPVLAYFSDDGCWHRATIVAPSSTGTCTVLFVDYGNTEKVETSKLVEIDSKFLDFPMLAVPCCLVKVKTGKNIFSKNFINAFGEMTMERSFSVSVTSITEIKHGKRVCVVDLESSQGKSVAQILLGNSKFKEFFQVEEIPLRNIPVSKPVEVVISHVETPARFFLHLANSCEELEELSDKLNEFYPVGGGLLIGAEVGSFCAAQFSVDQFWYRARVNEIKGSEATLSYVDFGNSENQALSALKVLRPDFAKIPCLSIPCKLLTECKMKKKSEQVLVNFSNMPNLCLEGLFKAPWTAYGDAVPVEFTDISAPDFKNDFLDDLYATNKVNAHVSISQVIPTLNEPIECAVSFICSPSEFYCQLTTENDGLQTLFDEINAFYGDKKEGTPLLSTTVGSYCAVTYTDGMWYRGKVTSISPESATVYYFDYGNTEDVEVSTIRALEPKFCGIRGQAIKCGFTNLQAVSASGWASECVDRVKDVLENTVQMTFLQANKSNTYNVQISSNGEDVATMLVNQGWAQEISPEEVLLSVSKHALTINPFPIEEGSTHPVLVTHVVSPFEVYCQVIDADEKLDILMEGIAQYCARAAVDCDTEWEPGNFALGLFTEDECWYRCCITGVSKERSKIGVHYLDYGNSESIGKASLLPLPPDCSNLPAQAIKCRVEGAQCYKFSSASTEDFNALLLDCEFIMESVSVSEDNFCAVNLCRVEDSTDIMKVAVEKNIVHTKISATNSCDSNKLSAQQFPDELNVDSFHDVQVVFTESPSRFYCQFSTDNIECHETMMTELQDFCSSMSYNANINKQSFMVGDFVAAQYYMDEQWYRAVVNKLEHNQAEVFFVDYGNEEMVEFSKMRKLTSQFMNLAAQSVCCSLAEVVPAGEGDWTDGAIEAFKALSMEHSCIAQIRSCDDMSGRPFRFGDSQHLPIYLIHPEMSKSVSKSLIDQGFALSFLAPEVTNVQPPAVKSFLHPKLKLGEIYDVYISNIESPSLFWLQFSSNEDSLMSIQDNLGIVYADGPASLQRPVPGSPCCAKYYSDDKWYRGIIEAELSTGVQVHFIDYGNTEVVAAADVAVIQPQLLAWEVQAFRCSLDKCHPVGNRWDQRATEVFSELVSDKLLNANIICGSVGNCWEVQLMDGATDIQDQLVQSAVVIQDQPIHSGAITVESSLLVTEYAKSTPTLSRVELAMDRRCSVYIAFIESPSKFFCQLASNYDNLESLMEEIAEFYIENKLEPPLEEGSYCVAQYSNNCVWYRAQIISIHSEGFLVNFVDYGNSEVVSRNQVLSLASQFTSLPSQAVSCSLVEDTATPMPDTVLNKFLEYDLKQEFTITAGSVAPNGQYVVQLFDQDNNLVNDLIFKSQSEAISVSEVQMPHGDVGAVSPVVLYHPLQFNPGDGIDALIGHVKSPSSFFCQPLEQVAGLDVMMTDIFNYMADNKAVQPLQQELVQPGMVCLSQFSEDNEWYRAQIQDVISGEAVLVSFVDYGNSEVVSLDRIVVLPPQFGIVPLHVIHCTLFESVEPHVTWTADQVNQFRTLVQESDHIIVEVTKVLQENKLCVTISRDRHYIDTSFLFQHKFPVVKDAQVVAELATEQKFKSESTNTSFLAIKGSLQESGSDNGDTESDSGSEGRPLIKGPFQLRLSIENEVLEVSVVHIEDPLLIYIQRADCAIELRRLDEDIAQYCAILEKGEHFPHQFCDGDFVLAKWSLDNLWYRGKVLGGDSSYPENTFQISFIDYGNVEAVASDALEMCPRNFLELPEQAIACSLTEVPHRDSWPTSYRDMINKIVEEGKILQATVILPGVDGMKPKIKLVDLDTGKDVSELVLEKLDEECESGPCEGGPDLSGLSEVIVDEELEKDQVLEENIVTQGSKLVGDQLEAVSPICENSELAVEIVQATDCTGGQDLLQPIVLAERNVEDFSEGSTHKVFVVQCINPHYFFCQFSREADTLESITCLLAEIYTGAEHTVPMQPSRVAEGLYVAAQFQEDKQWYRAIVIDCTESNMYQVTYIDFGNSENVPLECLRTLDESLTVYPPMSVQCALSGVVVSSCDLEWLSAAANMMLELTGGEECSMEMVAGSVAGTSDVVLTSSEGVDVGTALIEAQLASAPGEGEPASVLDSESDHISTSLQVGEGTLIEEVGGEIIKEIGKEVIEEVGDEILKEVKDEIIEEAQSCSPDVVGEALSFQREQVGSPITMPISVNVGDEKSFPFLGNVPSSHKLDCENNMLSTNYQMPSTGGDVPNSSIPNASQEHPNPETPQPLINQTSKHASSEIQPSFTLIDPLQTDIASASPIPSGMPSDSIPTSSLPEFAEHFRSTLTKGSCYSVKVISCSDVDHFTCKMLDQKDKFKDLMNEIASADYEVGIDDEYSCAHPRPALAVCCCSLKDDTWLRGEVICAGSATDTYKVWCVDIGVTENFTLDRIKHLKKFHADCLPPQFVRCSLPSLLESDVDPYFSSSLSSCDMVWPSGCVSLFEQLVRENDVLQMEVLELHSGSECIVRLFTDQFDVREMLLASLRDCSKLREASALGDTGDTELDGSVAEGDGGQQESEVVEDEEDKPDTGVSKDGGSLNLSEVVYNSTCNEEVDVADKIEVRCFAACPLYVGLECVNALYFHLITKVFPTVIHS